MSTLAEIDAQMKALEEKRKEILAGEKQEAIDQANEAIAKLAKMGFNYRLVEAGTSTPQSTGGRRTGVRDEVLATVKAQADGINRSDVLTAFGVKGDKRGEQSVSNALANLKKAGAISLNDGLYRAE